MITLEEVSDFQIRSTEEGYCLYSFVVVVTIILPLLYLSVFTNAVLEKIKDAVEDINLSSSEEEKVIMLFAYSIEEKKDEGEKINGSNQGEWKNTLLSILCSLVPKDCEQE